MSKDVKLSIHFNCLSSNASRSMLVLLVITLVLASMQSIPTTWDGKCIKNETINMKMVLDNDISNLDDFLASDEPIKINYNLYKSVVSRGSAIPSMITIKVDNRASHINNIYTHCPWSEPMPLTPMRYTHFDSSRDVCYTIKVGKQQMDNTLSFDTSVSRDASEIREYKKETLEEFMQNLREFNFGNCLADMNRLLFANYDQMLYTVNQFKFFDPSKNVKYNLQTPENMFMVREKQHGTVRDFIDGTLTIDDHPEKQTRDVIMFQMARAVNLIHLRGWIHKNLKNENFYVKKTVDLSLIHI